MDVPRHAGLEHLARYAGGHVRVHQLTPSPASAESPPEFVPPGVQHAHACVASSFDRRRHRRPVRLTTARASVDLVVRSGDLYTVGWYTESDNTFHSLKDGKTNPVYAPKPNTTQDRLDYDGNYGTLEGRAPGKATRLTVALGKESTKQGVKLKNQPMEPHAVDGKKIATLDAAQEYLAVVKQQ
ncbi:ribosome-inactivating family protein [Streptomyces abikoensis]|uniref:ribosome-inactivating family protein n=1 Tax=Streptomyces abikoensis TaxID=97398 RepID=UPI0036B2A7F9